MRSQLGAVFVLGAMGALAACSSSSKSAPEPKEAGSTACVDSAGLVNLFNANPGLACPLTGNTPEVYEEAITNDCASKAVMLKTGDVQYGTCFEYLVFEVDVDSTGQNFSKCFYDVSSHVLVGAIYADGKQDQCGGTSYTVEAGMVDTTCGISGFNGEGASFESCEPATDAGGESSLL